MLYDPSPKDILLSALQEAFKEIADDFTAEQWRLDAEANAILFLNKGRTLRVDVNGYVEETDGRIASTTHLSRVLQGEVQAALGRLRYAHP